MLSDRDLDWLLQDLCVNGGYCLPAEANARIRSAPPTTPQAFTEAVLRAEGFEPVADNREYRWVLEVVERAFGRSHFSPATTIREARERRGLDLHTIAVAAGLNDNWYFDVESYDTEVTSNVSLRQLGVIANCLDLQPAAIFEPNPSPDRPRRTLDELLALARAAMARRMESAETFSQTVGWEMAPALADARRFSDYTVDALIDLCRVVGVDWRDFLVDSFSATG